MGSVNNEEVKRPRLSLRGNLQGMPKRHAQSMSGSMLSPTGNLSSAGGV